VSATGASSQPTSVGVGIVNGWAISDQRGQCSAQTRQGGNLSVEIVHSAGGNQTTLLLRQPSWSAIRERHGDAATLRFSNGRNYGGIASAGRRTGDGESRVTTISLSSGGGQLLDDFARAHRIDISIGGVRAGTVSLRGTHEVAERLRSCAAASFRAYPPPPIMFVPRGPELPPGEAPPIHRSGTITNDDYPVAAIRAGQQGTVRVRLSVGADGRVIACSIVQSSGSAILDSTTCALSQRRFRYSPARDAAGNAVSGSVTRTIVWRLPEPPPPLPKPVAPKI
jgi:TonB family protein